MTDCNHNVDLNWMLQQSSGSSQSSAHRPVSKIVEKPRQENGAWCIVATDGSTSVIGCKSEPNAAASKELIQTVAADGSQSPDNLAEDLEIEREIGVDLSYLDVERETVSKLIAGMHAAGMDEPSTLSRREIEMPSALTDLHEMLKTDKVCMANAPKAEIHQAKSQASAVACNPNPVCQ